MQTCRSGGSEAIENMDEHEVASQNGIKDDIKMLLAINTALESVVEKVERSCKNRVWDICIFGPPFHVYVENKLLLQFYRRVVMD